MVREDTIIGVHTHPVFKKRAQVVCRQLKTTLSNFIRGAMTKEVEFYEAKFRAEEAQRQADKKAKTLKDRVDRSERGFGTSNLSPDNQRENTTAQRTIDRQEQSYVFHAKRILEVLDNPLEKRTRIAEAIKEIRQESPLMSPPDWVILTMIEKHMIEMKNEQKELVPTELQRLEKRLKEQQDQLVGTNIDTTKVVSQGDTDDE